MHRNPFIAFLFLVIIYFSTTKCLEYDGDEHGGGNLGESYVLGPVPVSKTVTSFIPRNLTVDELFTLVAIVEEKVKKLNVKILAATDELFELAQTKQNETATLSPQENTVEHQRTVLKEAYMQIYNGYLRKFITIVPTTRKRFPYDSAPPAPCAFFMELVKRVKFLHRIIKENLFFSAPKVNNKNRRGRPLQKPSLGGTPIKYMAHERRKILLDAIADVLDVYAIPNRVGIIQQQILLGFNTEAYMSYGVDLKVEKKVTVQQTPMEMPEEEENNAEY